MRSANVNGRTPAGRVLRFTLVLLGAAAGCAGPKAYVEIEASPRRKPDWARGHVPGSGGMVYFLGTAKGAPTLDEGRRRAMDSVLAQAARYIGAKVEERSRGAQGSQISAEAKARIAEAEQDDIYTERVRRIEAGLTLESWDVYLLVRIPDAELRAERTRQAGEADRLLDEARAMIAEAQRLLGDGRAPTALRRAREAEKRLRDVTAASAGRADAEAALRRVLGEARRAATSVVIFVGGEARASFHEALASSFAQAGLTALAPAATSADDAVRQAVDAGRFPQSMALRRDAALALAATVATEPGGEALGQRVCRARVRWVLVELATGEAVATDAIEAREFGRDHARAAQAALQAAARKVSEAVATRLEL